MVVSVGNLTCVRISLSCNVFDDNVVVPVGKLTQISFHSPHNVVVRNFLLLVLEKKSSMR